MPPPARAPRCRSSVVEHPLGKGEVESSILSGSTTINLFKNPAFGGAALFSQPIDHRKDESDENSCHHEGKDQADILLSWPIIEIKARLLTLSVLWMLTVAAFVWRHPRRQRYGHAA